MRVSVYVFVRVCIANNNWSRRGHEFNKEAREGEELQGQREG